MYPQIHTHLSLGTGFKLVPLQSTPFLFNLELCEKKEEETVEEGRSFLDVIPIHVKHCYHFHSVLRGHLKPMKVPLLRGGTFLI
jgi:hypothetical protein